MESKIWQNEPILKTKTDIENRCVIAKGEREGSRMDWEFGVNRLKLLHLEWISNEILLYSIWNYNWSLVMEHDGR